MPIKILFISHRSDIGGGELSLFDLVLWLHLKKKIIPYIILSEKGGLYDKFKDAGFHVELVPLPPLKKIKISSIINIIRIVKKNSINVIHANTTRAAMYSVFAKIFLNVKFVWHNRGTDKRGIFEYILSLFTDKLIAISHSVKSGLINAGVNPKKISVIYNGINLDLYNKNSDKKKRNIHPEITKNNKNIISQKKYNVGLIGRFTSEKGHKYLINAADLIINKYNFKNINFKFIRNDNFG
ncbi:glycosyltransferase family 4 protein, partial [Candidatus Dependentiae bacterium]|nr:glycosyltransferase family 4 protein [Candidatus Dependentiae bacterium]